MSMLTEAAYIVKSHKSDCCLLIANNVSANEHYAAEEMQSYLKQISGAKLPIITEREFGPHKRTVVSIGRTNLSKRYFNDTKLKALGDDGYCLFTADNSMFIVGGHVRGTMYGVYDFLESLGVRWYSTDYTFVPKAKNIRMVTKAKSYIPSFWYRDQYWNNMPTLEWKARMRINGNNGQVERLPLHMGGSAITMLGCHSFFIMVPADKYLSTHPEWFAQNSEGKRCDTEMCLTNPQLRQFVADYVLNDIKQHDGEVDFYWVSQNDGSLSGCMCAQCLAERKAHGGSKRWSANIISFASEVADKVGKQFPRTRVKTLAYTYTEKAPTNMRASDSLCVEVCGNFLNSDHNHADLVASWSKVAKNISVYTYGGSNYGYWWPYPNAWEVGMQCPWALKSGVKAFYIQGTALGKGSGLVDLKAYLSARMAWDPSRDVNKEIAEFCSAYYGAGGRYVAEYLDWYYRYIKQHNMPLDGGWGEADEWRKWVTKEAMLHCNELFQKALLAVKHNPIYLKHVRSAYLEVLWGRIMIDTEPGTQLSDLKWKLKPGANETELRKMAVLFGEIMHENGYDMHNEITKWDYNKYPHK